MEYAAFEPDAFRQGGLVGPVHGLLGHHRDGQGLLGNGLRCLHGLANQLRRRYHTRNQAGPFGLRRIHVAPSEAHFHGLGLADIAGEALRTADARHDAQIDLRLTEFGGVGRDDEITQHGQLAPAPQRPARYGGDNGLADVRYPVIGLGKEVGLEHVHVGLRRHLLDIRTSGESSLRACQNDAADSIVAIPCFHGLRDFAQQFRIQCIERLRAVERNNADAAFDRGEDVLIGHVKLHRWQSSIIELFGAHLFALRGDLFPNEAAFLACLGGAGGFALFRGNARGTDHFEQTCAGILAVALLQAILARRQNQHTVFGQPLPGKPHKPRTNVRR